MWFIKNTTVVPFEFVEVFHKDSFLTLYFFLYSLMIFRSLCLLSSAALFTLMIWPSLHSCSLYTNDVVSPLSPYCGGGHTRNSCFDWSAGLSTGVFLSIRANVRPPSRQTPTKLTSSPTSSYSAPASVSTSLQLLLRSPLTTLFFSKHASSSKAKFFPRLKALHCISASSWGPLRSPSLFCI